MDGGVIISILGLIIGLVALIYMVMKGVNIFITAFVCSAIVALTSQMDMYEAFKGNYVDGFTAFFKANWLMFLTGTLMGVAMEMTHGAESIAKVLIKVFGKDKAIFSIPLACGVLAYGGVSAFVCSFAVFQIALQVFKEANLPRRFIPAALCFGCSTFAMVAPGAVQIHNSIPANALGTTIGAGMVNGFISCGVMLVLGCIILQRMVQKEIKAGGHFVAKAGDDSEPVDHLPNPIIAILPLVITIVTINFKVLPLEVGVLAGAVSAVILMYGFVPKGELLMRAGDGCKTSIVSITNTCAVVAFGAVVQASKAFPVIIDAMTRIPGPPMVGVLIGTTVIAGICGSASGGLGIASAILGPIYTGMGVPAANLHRVMALSSSSLDSLPHNGYIITVTNGLCNETHKDAYGPVFWTTVVVPFIGAIVGVILFTLFPNLP